MVRLSRKIWLIALLFSFANVIMAQGYDQERMQLAKFIERMYNNAPFDGCRIVDDYDNSYFLSVVALDKTKYPDTGIYRALSVRAVAETGFI